MLYISAEERMSFSLYLLGFGILIIGLAYGAQMMGIPSRWIAVGVITLVGLGILTGVSRTRTRDLPK
jgi:membrane-bound acyltransferase YfiQ involved in biofilm formation